ncbi:MAG TPA: MFS transporter [Kineosporiaceae bacterium]|nr:MFS transporter [Kineosporiaceae bacterium]
MRPTGSSLITGPDARQRQARLATSAAFAAQGLMFTVLLTHLPQFTDRYGISEGTVTLVVLMVTVLAGVGSIASELLAAATSSQTALRCALLVIAGGGAAIGLAPGLPWFIAGFALYGVGVGAVDAGGNMQGVAVQHRYGRSIITSFHAVWSAAAIIGALYVAGGERLSVPLPASILPVAAVIVLIALVAGPRLLPPDSPGESLSGSTTPKVSAPTDMVEPTPAAKSAVSFMGGQMLLLGLAMICFWSVDSGVSNWSALYLRDTLDAADSTAALGYALYQAFALISRLTGDFAVRTLGAVTTVRVGAVVGTAGTLLVVLAPGPVVAIVGFGLAGLGLPVIAPLCFSAAGAAVRSPGAVQEHRTASEDAAVDSVVARLNVFNYLGALLGAVVVGGVATAADLRVGFIVPVLLAGTVFFLAQAFAPAENP